MESPGHRVRVAKQNIRKGVFLLSGMSRRKTDTAKQSCGSNPV